MNYFDMIPVEIQDLIMDFKTKKEEKIARMAKYNEDLKRLKSKIEASFDKKKTNTYTMKEIKKIEGMMYAYETTQAQFALENVFEFDPKDQLGIDKYLVAVTETRNLMCYIQEQKRMKK